LSMIRQQLIIKLLNAGKIFAISLNYMFQISIMILGMITQQVYVSMRQTVSM
jgi:hypothetical protein